MTFPAYDLSAFVNSNEPATRNYIDEAMLIPDIVDTLDMYDVYEAKFLAGVDYDKVNTTADPVIVYEKQGKPVAWYDLEMFCGYIA